MKPILAIISPCYNEEAAMDDSISRLYSILSDLIKKNKISDESFLYFVDDGSKDKTWLKIESMHEQYNCVKGLKFSRNFGHQNAILAGMLSTRDRADCFVTIDVDLQDDPLIIEQFIDAYSDGYDIVYGVKDNINDYSFLKKKFTLAFYSLTKFLKIELVRYHSDYRLFNRRALDAFSQFHEVHLFLRGMFPLLGFKTKEVSYHLTDRKFGETKYPFSKLFSFAIDGITSFSVAPIRLITICGLLLVLSSALFIVVALIAWSMGVALPTYAAVLLLILILGGIQITALGFIGEYIGKTYKEIKARPRFIKDRELF